MKIYYSSIDGVRKSRQFKTLVAAQRYAQQWVGEHPDLGFNYAVSDDGIGKIEVDGVTLRELFPENGSAPEGEPSGQPELTIAPKDLLVPTEQKPRRRKARALPAQVSDVPLQVVVPAAKKTKAPAKVVKVAPPQPVKQPPGAKGSPERLAAGAKAAETRRRNLAALGIEPKAPKAPPADRHVAALKAQRTMVERKIKGTRGKLRLALVEKLNAYDQLIAQAA